MLSKLAEQYAYERAKQFAGSEFGNFVRHDIAMEAKKRLIFLPYDLKVKASVGAGNWAAVPWLGFFDPLITTSATSGFYIVYLVNAQNRSMTLSLNQGTTAIYQEFGDRKGLEVLQRRAIDIRNRIPEFAKLFDTQPIDLGSTERLPAGYTAGHSFGRTYDSQKINPIQFNQDLEQMFSAYEVLIDRGGTTPFDAMVENVGGTTVEETRRRTLSSRIERASNVRKKVLERRKPICEGCGLDPVRDYSFNGPLDRTPLDVHHSAALNTLAEGESRRYKIPDDFLILCPTCHRMIHKQNDMSDIDLLKKKLKFSHG